MIRSLSSIAAVLIMVVVLTAGCIPVLPTTEEPPNEPPVAYIDSISATTVTEGQTVTFTGHGTDVGGTIVAYSWRSDIDGIIGTSATFSTSSLSVGTHYIYFKVQDNLGAWSKELYRIVNVQSPGSVKPSVNSLKFTPETIYEGQGSTLIWDVSNASTVDISPDIGNVPLAGNRLIYPKASTTYTLTAKNEAGAVNQNVRVFVNPRPKDIVELFSLGDEEGSVNANGVVDEYPKAGVYSSSWASGTPMQAFFSFDISMMPSSATIKSVSIDLTNYIAYGSPSTLLGAMGVFDDQYGVLDSSDYVSTFTHDALIYAYSRPIEPLTSGQLLSAVQKQVADKSSRFQVRVQFEKFFYSSGGADSNYLDFVKGKAKLTVNYE